MKKRMGHDVFLFNNAKEPQYRIQIFSDLCFTSILSVISHQFGLEPSTFSLEFSLENHEYFSSNPSSFTKKHNLDNKSRVQGCKKSIASLQVCVLTLHRNHANLLCIVKRLFNARPAGRATYKANLMYINSGNDHDSLESCVPFRTKL
jgi:hypothetical protein